MLEIILMLLGLAFPNSDTNTVTSDDPNQTTIENTQSVDDGSGGTGGNGAQNPPKTPYIFKRADFL